jgi:2-polyprenyl-3-methyl-5-hydroxy-6-metoxy-1,4-benzoquinol methylase
MTLIVVADPPAALRRRVHGASDLADFRRLGDIVCADVLRVIRPYMSLTASTRVLDFGCGCGRVMIPFSRDAKAEIYGTDIDDEAIAWCRANISSIAKFEQNSASPPLQYADAFFDFVYSISVFTHLPRKMEMDWLAELRRVIKPGGYLLLTTLGPHTLRRERNAKAAGRFSFGRLRNELSRFRAAALSRRLGKAGFVYSTRGGADGLPKFYGSSYHTHQHIRSRWGHILEILSIEDKGVAGHQDLILCRRAAR